MTSKKSRKNKKVSAALLERLKAEAEKGRQNAYAPYSGFKVGAALLSDDGQVFSGCNVENASYGGTICAERTAILKAVSEGARMPLLAVHVVSSSPQAWPPCGMCLQVMSEFCQPSTLVTISNQRGQGKMFRFSELLPESFDITYLLNR